MKEKIRVFKRTLDDWHGSYKFAGWYNGNKDIMLVEVSFLPLSDGMFRVCVWGNDDCGKEKDFKDKNEAWECFINVISWDTVNKAELERIGLIHV